MNQNPENPICIFSLIQSNANVTFLHFFFVLILCPSLVLSAYSDHHIVLLFTPRINTSINVEHFKEMLNIFLRSYFCYYCSVLRLHQQSFVLLSLGFQSRKAEIGDQKHLVSICPPTVSSFCFEIMVKMNI